MLDDTDDPFLTIEEAAQRLRVKARTLDGLRWQGVGPKFRRHGGRIVYRLSDLLAWSEERAARMTAQKATRTRSFPDDGSDDGRRDGDGLSQGRPPVAPLERQPQHADRPLPPASPVGR